MFILLLRNLCYFNDETGEIREDVWIPDGYETLAARLGLDNPRQVALVASTSIIPWRTENRAVERRPTRKWPAESLLQKSIACFVKAVRLPVEQPRQL